MGPPGDLDCQGGHPRAHRWVSEKHWQAYRPEIRFGLNRRFWERELCERPVKACVSTGTLAYPQLTKKDAANRPL